MDRVEVVGGAGTILRAAPAHWCAANVDRPPRTLLLPQVKRPARWARVHAQPENAAPYGAQRGLKMKRAIFTLIFTLLFAFPSLAQDTARIQFRWTQPDSTCGATPRAIQDGWLIEYQVFVASPTDTVMQTVAPAPFAVADTASAFVTFEMGVPQSVQVVAVDKWGHESCAPSDWSEIYIPIPDPTRAPGQPWAVE